MTTLNNFQRLSLVMQANQSVGDDYFVDPKLVGELVTSGQEWALRWEYGWLSEEEHPLDPVVQETTRIFEMYRHLQYSAEALGLGPKLTRFPGFDFNNDAHAGVAETMVEKLGRFDDLRGATDNSHSVASVGFYRRMLEVYEPLLANIQKATGYRQLTAEEIDMIVKP